MPSVQTLFLAAGRGWLCAPARRTAVKAHTAAARIDNVARAPARLISVFHHTAPGPVAPLRETEDNQVLNYFKGVTMQADERTDRRCTRRRVLRAGARDYRRSTLPHAVGTRQLTHRRRTGDPSGAGRLGA